MRLWLIAVDAMRISAICIGVPLRLKSAEIAAASWTISIVSNNNTLKSVRHKS
jgi:hypothetical protein